MSTTNTQIPIDPHTGQPVAFRALTNNIGAPEQLRELIGEDLWAKFTRGQTTAPTYTSGMSRSSVEDNSAAARNAWMQNLDWNLLNGYQIGEARQDYNQSRIVRAPDGTYTVGTPYENKESWKSSDWQKAAAMAAAIWGGGALVGGALGGPASGLTLGGSGSGGLSGMDMAADAALGTGNNITTAGGLLGNGGAAGGVAAVAPNMAATNPALIDSALGTAGYGASSAGAGGGAGTLLGSLPSWLPDAFGPAWEFVKDNPKLVGALAGGLLGGVGAQGGEEPAPYTGPMPTITRGGWQSSASGYKPMQQQSYGGGLLGGQSKPMGGIGRYMGILGR